LLASRSRLTNRHSLAALLQACEAADEGIIRRLLWFVGGRESTAHLIFEAAWLAELKTVTPDWPACCEVFEHAYTFGRQCALPGLAQGAARAIARVTDQNLNDPEGALRLADAMEAEIGPSPGQDDGRATILLHKGDTGEALAIWRELLPGGRRETNSIFSSLSRIAWPRLPQHVSGNGPKQRTGCTAREH
jgi:hypothetical protein